MTDQISIFKKYILKIFIIIFIFTIGAAGLFASNQLVLAQEEEEEETLYLPLIFNHAFILPEETIMLLTPGSGSRVTSPIPISGVSDPTFEQNLEILVLDAAGNEITEGFATIEAELGERGPFEAELEIDLDDERNIFILVFDRDARDGVIVHLSSVGVTFTPTGPEDIITRDPYPEQIYITDPQMGETISGGTVHVAGIGIASFEHTLVIEIYDEDGNVIAEEPVMVEAPDFGVHGRFQADISYTLAEPGPGRIVVRDISAAHGQDVHRSSVHVTLEP
jgi:hypothetical protein